MVGQCNVLEGGAGDCVDGSQFTEPGVLKEVGMTTDFLAQCNEALGDNSAGFSSTNDQDKKEIKKNLHKQCRKKAKEYKKAVLNDLMSKGKFGQAFKVLLKRKKYKDNSKNGKVEKVGINISEDQFESMDSAAINKYVMDELEKIYPGLRAKAEDLKKNDPSFALGFHENETTPYNIVVKSEKGKACNLDVGDLPPDEEFTAKPCKYCAVKHMHKSFVNDCSYMVSKSFPEEKVDELIGSNKENRKEFCQPNMKDKDNQSELAEIKAMAKNICTMAQDGLEPDFEIKTARNMYPDKTPELAKKRGQFIQKYLRDSLQNDCYGENPEDQPDWLKAEDLFQEKIKLSHPYYAGGKEGDYGPDPLAKKENQENEIKNYQLTLEHEEAELKKKIEVKKARITELKGKGPSSITGLKREISTDRSLYSKQKIALDNTNDFKKQQEIYEGDGTGSIKQISNRVNEKTESLHAFTQEVSDLEAELLSLEKQLLEKYKVEVSSGKGPNKYMDVKKLEEFYTEKNKGPMNEKRRAVWDKKLFDSFKMVKISGNAKPVMLAKTNENVVSPELDIMVNMSVDIDQYVCMVEPIQTRKTTVKGILKGVGQFGIAAILAGPAIVVGAGAGVLGIFNFLTSCKNCGDPGKEIPQWRMINPRYLGNKSQRKKWWRGAMGTVKDVISLDGALDMNKNVEVRKYNDFDAYAKKYYGDKFEEKSERPNNLTTKEIPDKTGKVVFVETKDANGKLYETIEYQDGFVIKKRYNKEGILVGTEKVPRF